MLSPESPSPTALAKHAISRVDLANPPPNTFELLGRPDVLIHLAWRGLPNYTSLHHFESELPVQYNFIRGLVASGLSNIVIAGTCFEYGTQSGPLSEYTDTKPATPYGFAKDCLQRQLWYLKNELKHDGLSLALTWARLFYLYGEGQTEKSLFPQIRKAAERGDTKFNMSRGEQLRDYLPVTEAASALVALAVTGRDNGVVNVCSGRPVSIRRLVEGWIEDNGWHIGLNLGYHPYPDYEPMAFWGDRRKLDRCLGER